VGTLGRGRCDLPKRLRRRLLAELEDDLRDFCTRLAEANRPPERRYAEDLPDDVCGEGRNWPSGRPYETVNGSVSGLTASPSLPKHGWIEHFL
jgi:hypothetical protein